VSDDYVTLARDADSFALLQIGKAAFCPFPLSGDDELSEKKLFETKDAFTEFRTQESVYRCASERAQVSLILRIIQHSIKDMRGVIKQSRVYMEVRNLVPYDGTDH
jgi:hypothetical protein